MWTSVLFILTLQLTASNRSDKSFHCEYISGTSVARGHLPGFQSLNEFKLKRKTLVMNGKCKAKEMSSHSSSADPEDMTRSFLMESGPCLPPLDRDTQSKFKNYISISLSQEFLDGRYSLPVDVTNGDSSGLAELFKFHCEPSLPSKK